MTVNLTLVLVAAVMFGCGIYLLLERSLSRVLVGVVLMGNGVNVLILQSGGAAGPAPIVSDAGGAETADPLPQALILTAIVITLGTTAFLLAMAYRSWQIDGHDDVQDDVEDAVIRRLAAADEASHGYEMDEHREEPDADEPVERGA
ncbi:Na(+)/H(+) antiporter subunit C [Nocardioides caldifontis]|uniref:Na(+)/H(+) antiporter subunit C n=1 Tax=Nocardioides caldifontis TaxID=2588938 RepID=UPI0011DFE49A|nr:Na(+)/H(+) antiporter subunit C [Nocardioides caldifontis]